jgi:hypothetical protein
MEAYIGIKALTTVFMKSCSVTSCNPVDILRIKRRFGGLLFLHPSTASCLVTCILPIYCLAYFSNLNMEAICPDDTSFELRLHLNCAAL